MFIDRAKIYILNPEKAAMAAFPLEKNLSYRKAVLMAATAVKAAT